VTVAAAACSGPQLCGPACSTYLCRAPAAANLSTYNSLYIFNPSTIQPFDLSPITSTYVPAFHRAIHHHTHHLACLPPGLCAFPPYVWPWIDWPEMPWDGGGGG
jgi:hypothetical protein